MPRLLIVTPTREPDSGWGRYSAAVLRHLPDRYETRVLDDLPSPVAMRANPLTVLRAARRIRRELADADLVFSHVAYPYSLAVGLATLRTGVPYVVACHGTYAVEPLHDEHRLPARWSFRRAARLFAVSSFTAERMREGAPSLTNVTVVPNGVEMADFEPAAPYDLDHRVLLTVGAFKPRKGQARSVAAFAQMADTALDVEYHLVGAGVDSEYADRVRRVAREHGVADRVHFEGRVGDDALERWYATADAFVLTPRYVDHHFEGFGLVYLEANRYGVPTVGTTDSGARDAIDHGRSGLCVANETDAVADALERVLTDVTLAGELSQGAREWAAEHSWGRCVDALSREFDAVLETAETE